MVCQVGWSLFSAVFSVVFASEYHSIVEHVVYQYPGKVSAMFVLFNKTVKKEKFCSNTEDLFLILDCCWHAG